MNIPQIDNQIKNTKWSTKPIANVHEFYLVGSINEAENYLDWFDIIRHADPSDVVKIYINSYGGDLWTTIQMLRAMIESQATIACSVEGACMSAATLIFMCCDHYEVSPHSMFMFHNYSGFTVGKGGEMMDQLKHERKWSERLFHEMYENFLTKEEVDQILNNKDIWMDGEEVIKRLQAKADLLNKKQATKVKPTKTKSASPRSRTVK